MKILLTGGSGFIASHFYGPLLEAGHEIVNFDLVDPSPQAKDCPYIKGDVRDVDAVTRAMEGCEAVLHLAAAHHDFGIADQTFTDVNEGGAAALCKAMDAHGVKQVCFYSTVAVYGDASPPHDETTSPEPVSPYGKTKLGGEGVFRQWVETGGGRQCLVIRPTVTFGVRNFANMYTLIRQIRSGKFVQVGPGDNIKSLSYVENIVAATIYLWLDHPDKRADFDVFNYIDKPDMTSRQIAATVYEALDRKAPGFTFPYCLARAMALPFDLVIALTGKNLPISSARLHKLCRAQTKYEADKLLATGFQPPVPLAEGIARMVRWYMAEGKDQNAEWHQPPAEVVKVD